MSSRHSSLVRLVLVGRMQLPRLACEWFLIRARDWLSSVHDSAPLSVVSISKLSSITPCGKRVATRFSWWEPGSGR